MRIAIPCVENQLCMHFGHCDQFAVVDVESETITGVEMLTPPAHEPGLLPRWLHEQGVGLVIAGGMGQRAQAIFADNDIETIVGAPVDTPKNLVEAWLKGDLASGENACDH
ncbi:MAG: NifB/NifX family molybdenum-iron cluster-binding protein [Planctomycetia bacterium]|jgi:predicted Fe-Mo cluster-binding NifX family protein